jgi:predicted nucleotidyltransferase component of viral defense system
MLQFGFKKQLQNLKAINMWLNLNEEQRLNVLEQTSIQLGLQNYAVEKDEWVSLVLKAVFQSKFAPYIIFKGGTSLSKAYHLINRFSEDIDLIIDKKYLGFEEIKSNMSIKRLRKASGNFIINEFREELILQLTNLGVPSNEYQIIYNEKVDDTSDPNTLELHYNSILPTLGEYVKPRVLIEMGARSMTEPSEEKEIVSIISTQFSHLPFSQKPFLVKVVVPTRTFIEKVLLLHEEFSKPLNHIRSERLTRHLYDLDKLMNTKYASEAYSDHELFNKIVEHRKNLNLLRNISYENHSKEKLNIIPPNEVLKEWEQDYLEMQKSMIIGESKSFQHLLERMQEIMLNFKNSLI